MTCWVLFVFVWGWLLFLAEKGFKEYEFLKDRLLKGTVPFWFVFRFTVTVDVNS